jgi:hypothetical protein
MGKENLVVAQSGGPTAVVNASLAGVIRAAATFPQIANICGLVNGLEGAVTGTRVDLSYTPEATLDRLMTTPAAALGSGRYKIGEADYERILTELQRSQTRYLISIGGNGSMVVNHRLAEMARQVGYDLLVMGVPKTMDNDLMGTDHSPGYGRAARFLALATRDTGRDLESMTNFDDVIILETWSGSSPKCPSRVDLNPQATKVIENLRASNIWVQHRMFFDLKIALIANLAQGIDKIDVFAPAPTTKAVPFLGRHQVKVSNYIGSFSQGLAGRLAQETL